MTSYVGFWNSRRAGLGCGMLVLTFSCHVVGGCVCLGLEQCFWGSTECAGDGFVGIIDLFYYKRKKIRDYHVHIFESGVYLF